MNITAKAAFAYNVADSKGTTLWLNIISALATCNCTYKLRGLCRFGATVLCNETSTWLGPRWVTSTFDGARRCPISSASEQLKRGHNMIFWPRRHLLLVSCMHCCTKPCSAVMFRKVDKLTNNYSKNDRLLARLKSWEHNFVLPCNEIFSFHHSNGRN